MVKDSDGKVVGCHPTKAKALAQLAALNINAKEKAMGTEVGTANRETVGRPPRDDLVRALSPGPELREAANGDAPVMFGHFAKFNEWTEIDSIFEGHFMERVAPSAFDKTFSEGKPKVTFQHGHDVLGDQALGIPTTLEPDDVGARYEVPLFRGIPELILEGLRAGAYGSSFRFRVMKEDFVKNPKRSDYNPDGLPERTILEAQVMEFGPVTYPAYAGATAGIRSLTDEFLLEKVTSGPGLEKLAALVRDQEPGPSPTPKTEPAKSTPTPATPAKKEPQVETTIDIDRFTSLEDLAARLDDVKSRQADLTTEFGTREFSPEAQTEWDSLKEEKGLIEKRIATVKERQAEVADNAKAPTQVERAVPKSVQTRGDRIPDNVYDRSAYRQNSHSPEDEKQLVRSGAMKVLENAVFPHPKAKREDMQAEVERFIDQDFTGELPERILATGAPAFRSGFQKFILGQMLSAEEQRALERAAFTLGSTGMPVVWTLDPTIIRTSNYVINPMRAISRIETISGTNEWRGVTSGAVVATYEAEATEAADQTPTLIQPAVQVQRAQTFVPYSREVDQDAPRLISEMAGLFQEAKDILEATQFLTGAGTTVFPQGILTGLTTTQRVQTITTAVFVVGDLYALQNALPPRARNANSTFLASLTQLNRIRALDTSGGSSLWVQLGAGLPGSLLGMEAYELSTMSTAITTTTKIMLVGDFATGYLIVDRIGMEIELIPHLFGATNRYPTGQRGLWAIWRNSAKVLDANRFRYLEVL